MPEIDEDAASTAASRLSRFKWQNCTKKARSAQGRIMARARWKESRKQELKAEARRAQEFAGAGA